ncbi:hypothetical protein DICPUDRAFT_31095 [Dictyostelium purpureum]|uniref:Eukaryotic translation initiation factor 2A n=1 Tax=Dictyostelium purpureum TaxID=5786 RepID=F0ZGK3_DICPU|nr:uncharacterized protein DICPUDRAFT_31095 [Dictyostelium purpureum]EGC36920.1 hypothetical protein DICPUDRAFT_31095 [Dictyostelium purpureum]|eukprot:XP_003286563.1 hypothetical protein DICPUDRAFT_31095 [Dictyostelium purpureum]
MSTPSETTTTTTSAPKLQLVVRSKTTAYQETSNGYGKNLTLPSFTNGDCRHVEYSKDGTLIAYVNINEIIICSSIDGSVHSKIERPNVGMISFSPQNSFLLTWERMSEYNNNENNLIVWDIKTKQILYKSSQKYCNQENWPLIKWTDDEVLAGKLNQNEVHFFNGRSIGVLAKKIKLADISSFDFAPGNAPYKVATFVPEKGSTPGSARIYVYPTVNEHVSHLTFFKASEAKVLWNKKGNAILVHTFTDTDKSGKSYYGETGLWFLSQDGSSFNLNIKGPIHDVQWSPTLDQFMVCYGNMPSQTTLFNLKGEPLVDFGLNPRNTIRFSPNGKLLCLGGFGNLQGDMDFWDLTRYRKICSTQSHCAVFTEWAADSIHFMTAVLSPRIRVDNGIKIQRYDNTVVYKEDIPELYQALWRPLNPLSFPNDKIIYPSVQQKEASPQPTKYTPPSLRNQQVASSAASPIRSPPGMELPPPPPGFKVYLTVNNKSAPKPKQPKGSNNTTTTTTTSPKPQSDEPKRELTPVEKKIRSVERKLKEVEILKDKLNSGEFIPPTAIEKINNESKFLEELRQLQQQL